MERDWPEGRGIFHNADKTFLVWVNEEDQLRIISMQKGGDVKGVFERLARGIKAVQESVKAESGKDFQISPKFGYIHSCPTNLGTGEMMTEVPYLAGKFQLTKYVCNCNRHEGVRARGPARLDQGGRRQAQGEVRGAQGAAQGHQGRVGRTDR